MYNFDDKILIYLYDEVLIMSAFSPVSSNKLYIQIHNQIRDAILNGTFQPGDKLPSEKELCQMFNVSRVPVREALCALELCGMVDSVQVGGVYVRALESKGDDVPQDIEPQDIIRVRMLLEPDIAREAALHLSEENRSHLNDILKRFRIEAEKGLIPKELDREFHLTVAKSSGSSLYAMIMELVFKAMEQKLWDLILSRTIATQKYADRNNREHIQICEAILDGRADDANTIMKEHMEQLCERFWTEEL